MSNRVSFNSSRTASTTGPAAAFAFASALAAASVIGGFAISKTETRDVKTEAPVLDDWSRCIRDAFSTARAQASMADAGNSGNRFEELAGRCAVKIDRQPGR